jgi:hypothetical protein
MQTMRLMRRSDVVWLGEERPVWRGPMPCNHTRASRREDRLAIFIAVFEAGHYL